MKRRVTRQPMPWLRPRLRAVNATASDLARHLGLPPVRVYELIKGRRRFQPGEIEKAASFLKIGEPQLLGLIEGRLSADDVGIDDVAALPWASSEGTALPLLRASLAPLGFWTLHVKDEFAAAPRPDLIVFPTAAFAVVVQDEHNSPVYRARDCILIDPRIPVAPGDDVALSNVAMIVAGSTPEIIAGQLTKMSDVAWSLRQYAVGVERTFSRTQLPSAWKIISRFAPVMDLSQPHSAQSESQPARTE